MSERTSTAWRAEPRYAPIENHGVIGDLHTIALVATDGTIDWCCLPHFDSPSVFASILDTEKGGYFRITSTLKCRKKQMYFPDTNVLLTRFLSEAGVGEINDFMPVDEGGPTSAHSHQIYRVVKVVRGEVQFRLECMPAFNYGRDDHRVSLEAGGAVFVSESCTGRPSHPGADRGEGARGRVHVHAASGRERDVHRQACRAWHGRRRPDPFGVRRGGVRHDRGLLANLAAPGPVPRAMARDGRPLGPGAQAPDVPAHGRDRGCPDHEPPRGARRRAQLGLSIHLGSRCQLHAVCIPAARLHE